MYQKVAQIKKIALDELNDGIFANWKNFNIVYQADYRSKNENKAFNIYV